MAALAAPADACHYQLRAAAYGGFVHYTIACVGVCAPPRELGGVVYYRTADDCYDDVPKNIASALTAQYRLCGPNVVQNV